MNEKRVRMSAMVSGHVQGVGFRDWVRRHAQSVGLVGSATNLADGRVEVLAEGSRESCEKLLGTLQGDDSPGHVSTVSTRWLDTADDLDGFMLG